MSAGEEVIIVVSQVCNAIAVSQKNSSESCSKQAIGASAENPWAIPMPPRGNQPLFACDAYIPERKP
jgi:hypothetical protein